MSDARRLPAIIGVPAPVLRDYWPRAMPLVQKALYVADTGFSIDSVLSGLFARQMQLWVVEQGKKTLAACVTRVDVRPTHKVLSILFLGGDSLYTWIHELLGTLEQYAESLDCKYVECFGRKGWERLGKQRPGYVPFCTIMRFEV